MERKGLAQMQKPRHEVENFMSVRFASIHAAIRISIRVCAQADA